MPTENLRCALCLIEDKSTPAITIANGHTMCGGHFANSYKLSAPNGAGQSLYLTEKWLENQL